MLAQHPSAKWIQWEPVNRDNARAGARTAFGQYVEPLYDLTKADVILSLDADFLSSEGAHNLHYMRQFASRRRVEESADNLNRLYVVESNHTRHRRPRRQPAAAQVEPDRSVRARGRGRRRRQRRHAARRRPASEAFADAVAKDLAAHQRPRRRDGRRFAAARGARARARDQRGDRRAGRRYLPTPEIVPTEQHAALRELVSDINAGHVQMLVIIGESNPVLSAPADFKFAEAMRKVSLRRPLRPVLRRDRDAEPLARSRRALSSKRGATRARIDGTVSIVQPLIQPLYGGKSAHEVIATMSDRPERNGYDVVREYWQSQQTCRVQRVQQVQRVPRVPASAQCAAGRTDCTDAPAHLSTCCACRGLFEKQWRKWLHDGFIAGSAAARQHGDGRARCGDADRRRRRTPIDGIEVNFRRDPTIYDGRFANNGWLQELPKPMTKLTWDNAALIAPATAEAHELAQRRHDRDPARRPRR